MPNYTLQTNILYAKPLSRIYINTYFALIACCIPKSITHHYVKLIKDNDLALPHFT